MRYPNPLLGFELSAIIKLVGQKGFSPYFVTITNHYSVAILTSILPNQLKLVEAEHSFMAAF